MVSRQTPSGADTEVRPPAPLSLDPGGRWARIDAQRTGAKPIQIGSLPIGTVVSQRMPCGADTEVRAPAVLVLLGVNGSWFARLTPSPQTSLRPNGPAVPPARPSGPGTAPPTTSFVGPTGQPFVFVSRAVHGSVGPLGLTERGWTPPGVGNMYLSRFMSPADLEPPAPGTTDPGRGPRR
jgi:hypothetical protein